MSNFINPVSLKKAFILPVIFLFALSAIVNENTGGKKSWHCLLEPYMIFPTFNEITRIVTLPDAELEVDATDIFSNTKIGFVSDFEMAKDMLAFSSNLVDVNSDPWLEAGVVSSLHSIKTNVDLQAKIPEGRINTRTNSMEHTSFGPIRTASPGHCDSNLM